MPTFRQRRHVRVSTQWSRAVILRICANGGPLQVGLGSNGAERDGYEWIGLLKGDQNAKQLSRARRLSGPRLRHAGNLIFGSAFSRMPRYFFNVHDERSGIDTEGEELPNNEAAWREATIVAGKLLRNMDGKFQPEQEWRLEVTDERRNPLYILRIYAEEI
jgi:Domain of unknown function (DUF6894)